MTATRSKTFTFITDYAGGTFLSQVRATSRAKAVAQWIREIDVQKMRPGTRTDTRKRFVDAMLAEKPVRVTGMHGVWCMSALLANRVAITHIVATEAVGGKGRPEPGEGIRSPGKEPAR